MRGVVPRLTHKVFKVECEFIELHKLCHNVLLDNVIRENVTTPVAASKLQFLSSLMSVGKSGCSFISFSNFICLWCTEIVVLNIFPREGGD